jgi:hypothetical protein
VAEGAKRQSWWTKLCLHWIAMPCMRGGSSAGVEAAAFTTDDGLMDSDRGDSPGCGWLVDDACSRPERRER